MQKDELVVMWRLRTFTLHGTVKKCLSKDSYLFYSNFGYFFFTDTLDLYRIAFLVPAQKSI
jgi:hypothetical protein